MNSLFTAIYTLFTPGIRITEDSDTRITESGDTRITDKFIDFYTDIGGRLYLGVAPQEATFPYCVYSGDRTTGLDFTDELRTFLISFDIFSKNNSSFEAGEILEDLKTMFDNCNLSVSGWNHLQFKRDSVTPNNDYSQVPPVVGYSVDYEVLLEQQRS